MYINLQITGSMQTSSFWLNEHNNNNKQLNEQILNMLNKTVKQNYFHYEGQIFLPEKGIAMGSPISSMIAETYLQCLDNIYLNIGQIVRKFYFTDVMWMIYDM